MIIITYILCNLPSFCAGLKFLALRVCITKHCIYHTLQIVDETKEKTELYYSEKGIFCLSKKT